jgi:16S rRNA (guanine966-N2)-methyltransferase
MAKRKRPKHPADSRVDVASELRIIGGRYRGTRLENHGDQTARPMKHRVREAIFNLVGSDVTGKHAIDVFAGTGAIGLEALSRGAASATFLERHVPTARLVQENIGRLGVAELCELFCTSAFLWTKLRFGPPPRGDVEGFRVPISKFRLKDAPAGPAWAVFCSPPYDFFVDRQADMIELIGRLLAAAPPESVFVVEADQRLDFNLLPTPASAGQVIAEDAAPTVAIDSQAAGRRAPAGAWRVRSYVPAQIGILRVPADGTDLTDSY